MRHRLCMKALCLAAIGPLLPESAFSERDMDNTRNVFSNHGLQRLRDTEKQLLPLSLYVSAACDSEEFLPHTCLRFELFVSNYR